jgi:hypothetical protein
LVIFHLPSALWLRSWPLPLFSFSWHWSPSSLRKVAPEEGDASEELPHKQFHASPPPPVSSGRGSIVVILCKIMSSALKPVSATTSGGVYHSWPHSSLHSSLL